VRVLATRFHTQTRRFCRRFLVPRATRFRAISPDEMDESGFLRFAANVMACEPRELFGGRRAAG
jgi:hypothetical protein